MSVATVPTVAAPAIPVPPARLTVEEFLAQHNGGTPHELVDGVLREIPMAGLEHGKVCARMTIFLGIYLETHDIGHVMSNDSFVQTGPASVRGADVLFYSYERLPKNQPVPKGTHAIAPDLVVEVKSPSDTWIEVFTKTVEYLQMGVSVVVLIDPVKRTVSVCRGDDQDVLRGEDTLAIPDVLPGFSLAVARLFV